MHRTPLVRPSVSVPLGCVSTSKPTAAAVLNAASSSKAIPMKAIHGVVQPPSSSVRPVKTMIDSPLRRYTYNWPICTFWILLRSHFRPSTSSTPSRTPQRSSLASTPSVISRPPLVRAGSDLTQQLLRKTAATLQHQSAGRRLAGVFVKLT